MTNDFWENLINKITINSILALTIIGSYSGMWLFVIGYGVTQSVDKGQDALLTVIGTIDQFDSIIITMTIIVVLVVQFYFRTSPPK